MSCSTFVGKGLIGGGSGCDARGTSEELPMPMVSSPTSPTPPDVQVKQYSWRHNAMQNECLYDKWQEFVGSGKQTNHVSLLLPHQAPLVSRAHLVSIGRKFGKLKVRFSRNL